MAKKPSSFEDIIQKDRETRKKQAWSGPFIDYLNIVKENHEVAKLSHNRIYQMIISKGRQDIFETDNPRLMRLFKNENIKVYNFFKDQFFGLERTIKEIVRYFYAASLKGEESRQVLYFVGPVGSGKSSLVEAIKAGLEESGPFFTIDGCPIQEEPLHLLPRHLRTRFEELLGLHIEGDLCPICRYRLIEEFNGEYEKFPVVTKSFSRRARLGIGVVPPVDPNNQDTSVLIGSEDISKLDRYGEGDPRVLDLNGALDVGNRGMVEFIEVFKNETEYLHAMITATQEKMIPAPGRHGMIHLDTCIIAHSNEAEWKKFKADHTNEAILDRIVTVKVPYNMELSEEVRIYQKLLNTSNFDAHIAPYTIELASMFAILTRLIKTNKCDPMTKLKIYNGEEVVEKGRTKKVTVDELREESPDEGMSGVSTRLIMKSLDNALSDHSDGNCVNPIYIMESLVNAIKKLDLPEDTKKEYLEYLRDVLHKEYLEFLEKDITQAFVYSYKEQAENLFQNYLDHAEAFINRTRVKDTETNEELEPDIKFMESIEEQIGIAGTAADGFRQEVIAFLWSSSRRGESIDYRSYEPLKDAIEKKLMSSVRDISRIITKARTRDDRQEVKYNAMVKTLKDNGYCDQCVEVVLKYAANNLWKD